MVGHSGVVPWWASVVFGEPLHVVCGRSQWYVVDHNGKLSTMITNVFLLISLGGNELGH